MRRAPIVLALALACLALGQSPPQKAPKKRIPKESTAMRQVAFAPGDPAPALSGETPERERASVRWGDRTLTVVNFWATWCVPCKAEMPVLQDLYARRGKDGLAIWGVEAGRGSVEDTRRFLSDLKIGYPVLRVDAETGAAWGGASVLPTTFLVSRDGKILRKYAGATARQTEGLVADVNAVLDGRPMGVQPFPEDEPTPVKP
jgi:thiol-disulfide isomerase/thioredoxin